MAGYYFVTSKQEIMVTAAICFAVVKFVFIQALQDIPVVP
jgi:hypothetical protein